MPNYEAFNRELNLFLKELQETRIHRDKMDSIIWETTVIHLQEIHQIPTDAHNSPEQSLNEP